MKAGPLVLLLSSLLLAACQPSIASNGSSPRPTASRTPAPTPTPTPVTKDHVFVIVMENTSYDAAMRQPYIASLAQQYGVATDYHAIGNPSLPNYLAMTSGSTWGVRDDGYHSLPATGIGNQLTNAGIAWRAYMEGFTGDCFASPYPYALKHNPFAYYGGQCPSNIVPLTALATDLGASDSTARLSWITPGLCHDGHDCSLGTADQWLAATVPTITASPAWQQNGILYVVWDEGSSNDQVALLVVSPSVSSQQFTMPLDHFSFSATLADQLGVARLGQATSATSLAPALGG